MVERRRDFVVVAGMLILSGVVQADLMPPLPAPADGGVSVKPSRPQVSVEPRSANSEVLGWRCQNYSFPIAKEPSCHVTIGTGSWGRSGISAIMGGLYSLPLLSFGDPEGVVEPLGQPQSVQILWDDQSSLSLGVYALISLGLFRGAGLVKKFSFRVIPDWYHEGGPFQVGHSFALSPDCRCSAPAPCFVPPDGGAQEHTPRYHYGAVVALWRKSQLLPTALAPRGPPRRTHGRSLACRSQ